jgi:hypothetical protein
MDWRIRRALELMKENLARPWQLVTLAKPVNVRWLDKASRRSGALSERSAIARSGNRHQLTQVKLPA